MILASAQELTFKSKYTLVSRYQARFISSVARSILCHTLLVGARPQDPSYSSQWLLGTLDETYHKRIAEVHTIEGTLPPTISDLRPCPDCMLAFRIDAAHSFLIDLETRHCLGCAEVTEAPSRSL